MGLLETLFGNKKQIASLNDTIEQLKKDIARISNLKTELEGSNASMLTILQGVEDINWNNFVEAITEHYRKVETFATDYTNIETDLTTLKTQIGKTSKFFDLFAKKYQYNTLLERLKARTELLQTSFKSTNHLYQTQKQIIEQVKTFQERNDPNKLLTLASTISKKSDKTQVESARIELIKAKQAWIAEIELYGELFRIISESIDYIQKQIVSGSTEILSLRNSIAAETMLIRRDLQGYKPIKWEELIQEMSEIYASPVFKKILSLFESLRLNDHNDNVQNCYYAIRATFINEGRMEIKPRMLQLQTILLTIRNQLVLITHAVEKEEVVQRLKSLGLQNEYIDFLRNNQNDQLIRNIDKFVLVQIRQGLDDFDSNIRKLRKSPYDFSAQEKKLNVGDLEHLLKAMKNADLILNQTFILIYKSAAKIDENLAGFFNETDGQPIKQKKS